MKYSGNNGEVKIGTNLVAEIVGFDLNESASTSDSSQLGDAADTHLVGSTSWSGTINCWYDDTDTNGQGALTIGASVEVHLLPRGVGSGLPDLSGTATITSIDSSNSRNSTITANFSFTGNGALTHGTQV